MLRPVLTQYWPPLNVQTCQCLPVTFQTSCEYAIPESWCCTPSTDGRDPWLSVGAKAEVMKLKSLLAREIGTDVVLSFFLDFPHLRHLCLPFRKGDGGGVSPLLLVLLIFFCLVYLGEWPAYLQSVVLILSLVWQFLLLGCLLHPTVSFFLCFFEDGGRGRKDIMSNIGSKFLIRKGRLTNFFSLQQIFLSFAYRRKIKCSL